MKNKIILTILYLILFLFAIGCSDFINWLGEDIDTMEEYQNMEDNLDEREDEGEIVIYSDDTDKESKPEKRDVESAVEMYRENQRKQDIDRYKDSEIEKRDKEGNKTYWENEQDSEF